MTFEKQLLVIVWILFAPFLASASALPQAPASQPLVSVGNRTISSDDLERVINSSPVATQFNTMGIVEQAQIRGRMLKNLIYSEMLYQEGLAQQVDQRESLKAEVESYRRGLLYRYYLASLRNRAAIPDAENAEIKKRLQGDGDALAATRAATVAERFADIKRRRLVELGKSEDLNTFTGPLEASPRDPQALVAKGAQIVIHLQDLVYEGESLQDVERELLLQRLDAQVEHKLIVQSAEQENLDVSAPLEAYRRDLVRQIVMKEKENAWVPDRAALQAYYDAHPELSRVAEQWQIGQIVVATREQAETLHQRILDGESLYALAKDHSIDPYGRQHAGDMGWVRPDQAPPALRNAAAGLADGQLSPVIETAKGFHILVIEGRKPGYQKPLREVAGGIRRSLILDRLARDYVELSQRYPIHWHLPKHNERNAVEDPPSTSRVENHTGTI